jgi:hypothetical protein
MRSFSPEDKLVRTQEMLSTELDQETVLMSVDAGAYYGMAGTARSIWQRLERPLTFSDLVDQLAAEYAVTPETCAADLHEFLGEMEREGLLRVE